MRQWAAAEGMPFFTTSALRGGQQINFLFHTVAEKCIRQSRERQLAELERKNKAAAAKAVGGGGIEDYTVTLRSSFGKNVEDSDDELNVKIPNPQKCCQA